MNRLIVCFLFVSFLSCSKSNSSGGGGGSATSGVQDFVVSGKLEIGSDITADAGEETRLGQRVIDVVDANQNIVLKQVQTGPNGDYVIPVSGSLAINTDLDNGETSGQTGLRLTGQRSLHLRTVLADTESGKVIGIDRGLDLQNIVNSQLALGNTPLEKLTAIRGKISIEGAQDHSGIVAYVPGTSYSARTDSAGLFVMTFIPSGTYQLKFEKDGYDEFEIPEVVVNENDTSDVGEHKLFISGGATGFVVTQVGLEGISRSREVSFSITAGQADRFKVGLENDVDAKEYGPLSDQYNHIFEQDGTFELVFAFATRDGFESQVTKKIIVDTVPPDLSGFALADRTSSSTAATNELKVYPRGANCTDIVKIAIVDQGNTPEDEDFTWNCFNNLPDTENLPEIPVGASYSYDLWAIDAVGNRSVSAVSGSIAIDLAAPTAPAFTIADVATGLTSIASSTSVNVSISDCTGVDYILVGENLALQPTEAADFITCSTTPFAYSFSSTTVGTKTIHLWSKDLAGNISDASEQNQIVFDNRLPGIPAFTITDVTSGSSQYTNAGAVKLTVSSCSNIDKIAYGESLTTAPALASFTQNCSTGVEAFDYSFSDVSQGSKTIYMWGLSTSGVVSVAAETAFTFLTTSAPSVPSVNIRDAVTLSTTHLKSTSAKATIGDCTGINKVLISFTQSTQPDENSIINNCTTATDGYSISLGATPSQGTHTPYIWVKDIAGNIAGNALTSLTYDSVAPTPPSLTLNDQTSDLSGGSDITTIDVTIGNCAGLSKVIISESQVSQPSYGDFSVNCNDAVDAYTHTFANNIEGNKTVLLWVMDEAGNISNTSSSANIVFDETPPNAPSAVTLTDPSPANSGYSNSLTLDVAISACADTTHVLISETQSTQPSENEPGFIPCTTSGIQVTAAAVGLRTFYVWARDIGGNVAATSQSASITVDTTNPTAPSITLEDETNDSTLYTNSTTVDVLVSSCADADEIYLSESSTVPAEGLFVTSCTTGSIDFTFSNGTNESKTVYLHVKDMAGNISSAPSSQSITLDTNPPVLPSTFDLTDSTNSSNTYSNSVTLNYAIDSCVAGTSILIRQNQSTSPTELDGSWSGCATTGTATFGTGTQGLKTMYLWVKDQAGNISIASISDSITYDSVAPSTPTFSIEDDDDVSSAGYTNSSLVDVTLSAGACSGASHVVIATTSSPVPGEGDFSLACSESVDNYSQSLAGGGEGIKSLYIWLKDEAGNISSYGSNSIYYDNSTPVISNVRVTQLGTDFITVSWNTSENVPTELSWGTSVSNYANDIGPTGSTQTHSATIPTLTPYTEYFFEVKASDYAEHTAVAVEDLGRTIKISKVFHDTTLTKFSRIATFSNRANDASTVLGCDINDDGKDDLVLSDPAASSNSHTNNGSVYVVFGSDSIFNYEFPGTNTPDITYFGDANSRYSGKTLLCGDWNGDGKDDLYIGSLSSYGYIILGSNGITTGSVDLDAGASNYDLRFSMGGDLSGTDFGDVNNDSFDDLIICQHGGACYGFLGGNPGDSTSDFDMDYSSQSGFGYNATIANVDGDSYRDIVIGTWDHNGIDGSISSTGSMHIKQGDSSLTGSYTTADYAIFPNFSSARLSISLGADFDGDGYDDLLLREYTHNTGSPYLFFGMSAGTWSSLSVADKFEFSSSELNRFDSHEMGSNSDDFFQKGFWDTRDFNADGKADILIGDLSYSSSKGRACLYLGRSQANWDIAGVSNINASEAALCIVGADNGDRLGFNSKFIDIDGDGKLEIVVNSIDADGNDDATLSAGEHAIIYFDLPPNYENIQIDLSPHF